MQYWLIKSEPDVFSIRDLERVGRYKLNQKLDLNIPIPHRTVSKNDVIRLVRRMIRAAQDPVDPTTLAEVVPLLEEVRDFLLADGQLSWLIRLVEVVEGLPEEIGRAHV